VPSEFAGTAALQSRVMPSARAPSAPLRWFLAPLRVLLLTFLLALLSFAVCLFLGILGLVISARLRGVHPNMTIAYREIAFPAAILAGAAALVAAIVMEVRHGRQREIETRFPM
jgi:amino acid transporter